VKPALALPLLQLAVQLGQDGENGDRRDLTAIPMDSPQKIIATDGGIDRRRNLACIGHGCFAVLVLGVAIASAILWVRSYGEGSGIERSFHRTGSFFTLTLDHGRLTISGPPASPARAQGQQIIESNLAGVSNGDVRWRLWIGRGTDRPVRVGFPSVRSGTPGHLVYDLASPESAGHPPPEIVRPLLAALDDPDRFAGAHVTLSFAYRQSFWESSEDLFDSGFKWSSATRSGTSEYDGLRVELSAARFKEPDNLGSDSDFAAECRAKIDPGQLSAIRRQWHRRLDVCIYSIPYWPVQSAAALLTLVCWQSFLRKWTRRRVCRRQGRCLQCGYDLRASPDCCPECGAGSGGRMPAANAG
jgi:hypothetical protein